MSIVKYNNFTKKSRNLIRKLIIINASKIIRSIK